MLSTSTGYAERELRGAEVDHPSAECRRRLSHGLVIETLPHSVRVLRISNRRLWPRAQPILIFDLAAVHTRRAIDEALVVPQITCVSVLAVMTI